MKVSISDYDALIYKTCICLQIIFIPGYYVTDLIPSSVGASKKNFIG